MIYIEQALTNKMILLMSAIVCFLFILPECIRALKADVRHHDKVMVACILLMSLFYSMCATMELATSRKQIPLDFLWIVFDALQTVVYYYMVKSVTHKREDRHAPGAERLNGESSDVS